MSYIYLYIYICYKILDTSELYHVIYAIFWIVVSHNAFHLYLHPIITKILILSGIGQYIIKNISFRITLFWLVFKLSYLCFHFKLFQHYFLKDRYAIFNIYIYIPLPKQIQQPLLQTSRINNCLYKSSNTTNI